MKGKSQHLKLRLPKRLSSLMVIVAGSALTFQMVRGVTSRPGAVAPPLVAPRVFTFPVTVLPPNIPRFTPHAEAESPFFVFEHSDDTAFVKTAPEGIDDTMIIKPEDLESTSSHFYEHR